MNWEEQLRIKAFLNVLIVEVDGLVFEGYINHIHIYTQSISGTLGIWNLHHPKDNDLKDFDTWIFRPCTHSKMVLHRRIGKILGETPF